MRSFIATIAPVLMVAGVGLGCGGSGTGSENVLTTFEVTPADTALFTIAPGNAVTLTVVAKDQHGQAMAGSPSFTSDNGASAGVSGDGTITAVAAGSARITASLTVGAVTKTASMTVTTRAAPASAAVAAPAFLFQAATVDVRVGGAVNWTFASVSHDVTFTTATGAPADVPAFQNGSAVRTFSSHGSFDYHCSIHPGMNGVVNVH